MDMTEAAVRLTAIESRAARRLGRLFRIERAGRFERRPIETVGRLVQRRAGLIDELIRLDAERRTRAISGSVELDAAIGELQQEIDRSQTHCIARIAASAAELGQPHAGGIATGLRDG